VLKLLSWNTFLEHANELKENPLLLCLMEYTCSICHHHSPSSPRRTLNEGSIQILTHCFRGIWGFWPFLILHFFLHPSLFRQIVTHCWNTFPLAFLNLLHLVLHFPLPTRFFAGLFTGLFTGLAVGLLLLLGLFLTCTTGRLVGCLVGLGVGGSVGHPVGKLVGSPLSNRI